MNATGVAQWSIPRQCHHCQRDLDVETTDEEGT